MTSPVNGSNNSGNSSALPARRPPPTVQESAQQAAESYLNKASKLQVLQEAVWLRQLSEHGEDELRDLRNLKAKRLGGQWAEDLKATGGKMGGDLIVCDDYHRNDPEVAAAKVAAQQPAPAKGMSPWTAAALTAAGLLAAGGATVGGIALLKPSPTSTQPMTTAPAQSGAPDWQLRIAPGTPPAK